MKKLEFLELIEKHFESSSGETAQFKNFYKVFKREMKQMLKDEIKEINFHKGHFFVSGFIKTNNDKIFYFTTDDVRWLFKSSMTLRTAKNFEDYTGGSNNYVPYNDNFCIVLKDFIAK